MGKLNDEMFFRFSVTKIAMVEAGQFSRGEKMGLSIFFAVGWTTN